MPSGPIDRQKGDIVEFAVEHSPAYALGIVTLEQGDSIQAEAGAMVSMSETIAVDSNVAGGILSGFKRSVLGGESFFLNTFTAEAAGGEVTVAPALPGDIAAIELTGSTVLVQSGSFLAASPEIVIDTSWGGSKTFFLTRGAISSSLFRQSARCSSRATARSIRSIWQRASKSAAGRRRWSAVRVS